MDLSHFKNFVKQSMNKLMQRLQCLWHFHERLACPMTNLTFFITKKALQGSQRPHLHSNILHFQLSKSIRSLNLFKILKLQKAPSGTPKHLLTWMLRLRSTPLMLSRFLIVLSMWLCSAVLVTDVLSKLRACCRSHRPVCTSWACSCALPKKTTKG